jgi:chitinase
MARFSFGHLVALASVAFMALLAVDGTQIMHRPDNYKSPLRTFPQEQNPKVNSIQRRATGKASFAYFTNWGIYGANFREWLFMCYYLLYF